MFVSWLSTGFATGMLIFFVTLGLIQATDPKIGQALGVVLTTILTIVISDVALHRYVEAKEAETKGGFFARWAASLIAPIVGRRSKRHNAAPRYAKASFLAYTFWSFYSGAIVTQGVSYEYFGRRPSRFRTVWGGLLFGSKLGVIYAAVALAVNSGGDFWENWWGAWV